MRIGAKGKSKEQGLIRAKGRGEGYRVFSRSRGQQKVNRLSTEAVSLIGDLRCIDATLGGEGKGCVLCLIAGTHDGATDGGGIESVRALWDAEAEMERKMERLKGLSIVLGSLFRDEWGTHSRQAMPRGCCCRKRMPWTERWTYCGIGARIRDAAGSRTLMRQAVENGYPDSRVRAWADLNVL